MPLRCKGLVRVKESGKTLLRRENYNRRGSGRHKMNVNIAFTFLRIKVNWERRRRKRLPKAIRPIEEAVGIERTLTFQEYETFTPI